MKLAEEICLFWWIRSQEDAGTEQQQSNAKAAKGRRRGHHTNVYALSGLSFHIRTISSSPGCFFRLIGEARHLEARCQCCGRGAIKEADERVEGIERARGRRRE